MAVKDLPMGTLRNSGIPYVADVPWGTHFCAFYETEEDLLDILIPYFQAGLANNEHCLWVVSEPFSPVRAANLLQKALPAFYRKHMKIIPSTEWYLKYDEFQGTEILEAWADEINFALAQGYEGLRIAGSTTWLNNDYWKEFLDYEAAIEREIGNFKAIVLCPFQLSSCSIQQVLALVSNHQFAFIKSKSGWMKSEAIYKFNYSEILGQMAAGVVHEIRNPIASVRGFIQLLKSEGNLADYDDYFRIILDELDRANEILSEYLSLARDKRDIGSKRQNLNDILATLLPLFKADANKEGKDVLCSLGKVADIVAAPNEIRQVLLNLFRNGLEAMEKGGVLEFNTYMDAEGHVVMEIRDQGKGIPEKILHNLGTPYLTTKKQGTGLGLFICFKILESYQAKVTVDSSSAGTRFIIRFPAAGQS